MGLELLKGAPLFHGLSDEVLGRFLSTAKTRTYPASEIVFVEMSEGDEIYLITDGQATVQFALANVDQQFEIVTLGPGEILGEISFIEQGQRSATVIAKTDLTVMVWDCASWRRICEEDHDVGYRLVFGIAKILCERLRRLNVRLLNDVSWGVV
jgi:CRP-like cAMP-binding protein